MARFRLAIHGGAGTIARARLSQEKEQLYRDGLASSLMAGFRVLAGGGSSLDAVTEAVVALEDSPLFNAGKGAVFTGAGTNELDAAVMDGTSLKAGAVAGVTTIRNPVLAARAVMEKSPHVLLIGAGAEIFARESGLAIVDPAYFFTDERYGQLQRLRERGVMALDHDDDGAGKFGTVGAVAVDGHGNLAAATSTGGITNKRAGRVGDTPLIGAGTYAANDGAAMSATGTGESFIRAVAGHDLVALMRYRGLALRDAAEAVIAKIGALGGSGGLIAVDARGEVAMPFNSTGMYRGVIGPEGLLEIAIFR